MYHEPPANGQDNLIQDAPTNNDAKRTNQYVPLIRVEIEPKIQSYEDPNKLRDVLRRLAEEDPLLHVTTNYQSNDSTIFIVLGSSEYHLDVVVDRLKREHEIEVNVGRPGAAYRETMTCEVKRQVGLRKAWERYAKVEIEVEPLPEDSIETLVFENTTTEDTIPKEFIKPTQAGIEEAMQGGILAGYPVVGLKVRLIDGSFHEIDSDEMSFKIAGSMALKAAFQKGGPIILEPVARVQVVAPDDYTGDVMGDLSSRRALIEGMEPRPGGTSAIKAIVPVGEMIGYATELRSRTQGRGNFTMEFERYSPAPNNVADKIMKGAKAPTR